MSTLALFLIFGVAMIHGTVAPSETEEFGPTAAQDHCVGYNQALAQAADVMERRYDVLEATRLRDLSQPCNVNTATTVRAAR